MARLSFRVGDVICFKTDTDKEFVVTEVDHYLGCLQVMGWTFQAYEMKVLRRPVQLEDVLRHADGSTYVVTEAGVRIINRDGVAPGWKHQNGVEIDCPQPRVGHTPIVPLRAIWATDDELRERCQKAMATEQAIHAKVLADAVTCVLQKMPGFMGSDHVHPPLPRVEYDTGTRRVHQQRDRGDQIVDRMFPDMQQVGKGMHRAAVAAKAVAQIARSCWLTDIDVHETISSVSDHTIAGGRLWKERQQSGLAYECDGSRYERAKRIAWARDEGGLRTKWEAFAFRIMKNLYERELEDNPLLTVRML